MENLLDGKSLVWISLDEVGVFTAATHKMLADHFTGQAIKVQLMRAVTAEDVTQIAQRQVTGLVTLVVHQASEVPAACKTFWRLRGRVGQPICVCLIAPDMIEQVALLLESGAQVVVSQLNVWQRTLPRVLSRVQFSNQGFHPITAGLVDRLPWSPEK